jgi:hypothetical protein
MMKERGSDTKVEYVCRNNTTFIRQLKRVSKFHDKVFAVEILKASCKRESEMESYARLNRDNP